MIYSDQPYERFVKAYVSITELFRLYPDLEKLYYTNPTTRASIEVLMRSCKRDDVLNLIHQLLIKNNTLYELYIDAANQGYFPKQK